MQPSSFLSSFLPTADALSLSSLFNPGEENSLYKLTGTPQAAFERFPITVNPKMKRIDANIPYANGPDIQKKLIEYEKALEAPQSPENQSRLRQNIERLKEYQELPERLQEAYYEKEKHLYGLSKNVKSTQEFMGDWMEDNGPKFNNWSESFVLNKKMLGSWQ